MKCPKCKAENQWDNFCSNCGNQLKEKCPECGQMEEIGRNACETKVKEAREALLVYKSREVGSWRIGMQLLLGFGSAGVIAVILWYTLCVYLDCLTIKSPIGWKLMLPIDAFLIAFIIWFLKPISNWQSKALNKAEKEFLRQNPAEAALLERETEST